MTEDFTHLSDDALHAAWDEAVREEGEATQAEQSLGPSGELRAGERIPTRSARETANAARRTDKARCRREAIQAEQQRRAANP